MLVGRGNELFFTKQQCELDYLFNWLWSDLEDIEDVLEQGDSDEK